jgi:nicotinamide riboside kinase
MKVAFVGAHGTGKTTLVNALSEHLRSSGRFCAITPEVPRVICETSGDPTFFRRGNNSLIRQTLLLTGQPIYEVAESAGTDSVLLCDRAILDHWAYTLNLFYQELQLEKIMLPLENFVAKHCSSYDTIFYVPIEFSAQDDGVRESDPTFQLAIDIEVRRLLDLFGLKYHRISGTIQQRMSQVTQILSVSMNQQL